MEDKKYKYKIVYYSGTGGTKRTAECFDKILKENGCIGELERISTGEYNSSGDYDLLFLIFPVHAFNAPAAVYKWIRLSDKVKNTKAAVISVSGGGEVFPNRACRQSSISRLNKKGYHVLYENMIVMPSNWIVDTKEPLSVMLLQVLPDKVNNMVDAILRGEKRRTTPFVLDRIFSTFGELEKIMAGFWGHRIKVSGSCNSCGLCSRVCPSGNITMKKGKPDFGHKCHLCLNCIYSCPGKNLTPGFAKFIIVKQGYNLDKLESKLPLTEKIDIEKLAKGYLFNGVKKYLMEH
ncbi:EFR1 family ferrodoxin [Anaerocolumna sp. MB42-C2]|uniref:EFR1 family ferrodoxin n=1 Tax=Anaerocolumna sp. MB42-C2 TaxID=3070997 RepID=UPI0027E1843B|nr:EFR1 family ferrodoxin [Anaerocolumna sp. MB42-C2]WMJ86648.1 EFR1 family ferrodoxin [Anaerocolumna sp. MB42-C2]